MADELTADAIADLMVRAGRKGYYVGGISMVTVTTECVEMLCREWLRLRADLAAARAELRQRDHKDTPPVGRWMMTGGENSEGI